MLDKQLEELTQRIAIEFYRAKSMMMGSSVPAPQGPLIKRIEIKNISTFASSTGVSMSQLKVITPTGAYNFGTPAYSGHAASANYANGSVQVSSTTTHANKLMAGANDYWAASSSGSNWIYINLTNPSQVTELQLCDKIAYRMGCGNYLINFINVDNTVYQVQISGQTSTITGQPGSIKPIY